MPTAGELSAPSLALSTKEQLIVTAERLFAVHGVDGVSLRQIGAEAGNANNSVVSYHFGSKDALVQAILLYRLPHLLQRRQLLAARVPTDDLRATVEAHFLPIIEQAELDDSYYLTFLEQLQRYGTGEHPFEKLPAAHQKSHRDFVRRLSGLLGHLPKPLRSLRIEHAMSSCLHASADRERARHFGAARLPFGLHVSVLLDGLVGFLQAPASEETLRALTKSSIRSVGRMPLP